MPKVPSRLEFQPSHWSHRLNGMNFDEKPNSFTKELCSFAQLIASLWTVRELSFSQPWTTGQSRRAAGDVAQVNQPWLGDKGPLGTITSITLSAALGVKSPIDLARISTKLARVRSTLLPASIWWSWGEA
jgi:hypothetical protein